MLRINLHQNRLEMFQLVFAYFFPHQIDFYLRRHIRWYWYRLSICRHLSHNLFEDTELPITFPDLSKSNADREIFRNNYSAPSSYCSISLTQEIWSKTADVGLKRPMFESKRPMLVRYNIGRFRFLDVSNIFSQWKTYISACFGPFDIGRFATNIGRFWLHPTQENFLVGSLIEEHLIKFNFGNLRLKFLVLCPLPCLYDMSNISHVDISLSNINSSLNRQSSTMKKFKNN